MRLEWKRALAAGCLVAGLTVPPAAAGEDTHGIPNASFPEKGILAAGQPTGEQLQLLAEDGYRTVIDLRPDSEPRGYDEAGAAKANGLAYVNIPVTGATLDKAAIDRFVAELDKAERPVIVHCASSNRVGALYYAWLREKGTPRDEALAKGKAAGLKSPELIEKVDAALAGGAEKPKG
ncbi:MAG TPA: protein tyrosine phosphatase family protein [Thermoanaerobaculia bacterium]|nr:protein tyrosine phosphatase family protein [Thermoanaerobaculia bacterium]